MTAQIPRELERFVRLFNREEFWASHEELEDAWRRTGSDFYQGLILYASAFVHAVRGNSHGIVAQLDKAEERLTRYRPTYLGMDVEALLDHGMRCRRIVEETRALPRAEREPWLAFPHLRVRRDLISGDEPELQTGPADEADD